MYFLLTHSLCLLPLSHSYFLENIIPQIEVKQSQLNLFKPNLSNKRIKVNLKAANSDLSVTQVSEEKGKRLESSWNFHMILFCGLPHGLMP